MPHKSITIDRILQAVSSDENMGFCLSCGADTDGVEPDARQYKCSSCGELQVYGAEEILIMGIAREPAEDDEAADIED